MHCCSICPVLLTCDAKLLYTAELPPLAHRGLNCCHLVQLVWFVGYAKTSQKEWDDGEVTEVHALPEGEFNKAQFNLRLAGIGFGILFIAVGPLLFLPAARGSLVNTFLGVHYGTAIKWHRCAHLLRTCCMCRRCFCCPEPRRATRSRVPGAPALSLTPAVPLNSRDVHLLSHASCARAQSTQKGCGNGKC